MGMSLADGGHLTHGMPGQLLGQATINIVSLRRATTATRRIDYDEVERFAKEKQARS